MRVLLDTHSLIWLITDDAKLGKSAREAILDPANDVFVSVVSYWEMAMAAKAGKLAGADLAGIMQAVADHGLSVLPLETRHLARLSKLPIFADGRAPFKAALAAQAIAESLILVSGDIGDGAVRTLQACD